MKNPFRGITRLPRLIAEERRASRELAATVEATIRCAESPRHRTRTGLPPAYPRGGSARPHWRRLS